jgi:hypothetical protein
MPKSSRQASVAPPVAYQGVLFWGRAAAEQPELAAVVKTVRVAVPAVAPVRLTGVVAPKLRVGGFTGFAGVLVIAAVSVTLPVKPPLGVTVMVEVLPVVAPGRTEADVPVTVKLGVTGVVTDTAVDEPEAPL